MAVSTDVHPLQGEFSAKMLRRRKAQAEQSAEMRTRIFKAAVKCLKKYGYAATTTLLVQKEAKISRGAMLHHFPTRPDLMLYVVRRAFDEGAAMHKRCRETSKDLDRDLPDDAWKSINGPSGIAALEILMGGRSDPQLAERLKSLDTEIEREQLALSEAADNSDGNHLSLTNVRTFYWALRGLSIADLVIGDREEVARCLEHLKKVFLAYRDLERRSHEKGNQ